MSPVIRPLCSVIILLSSVFFVQAQVFITSWVTTDGQITIPTFTGETYNYSVSWFNQTNPGVGEGTIAGQTGDYTITGLENGSTYQVEISGIFPRIHFFNGGSDRLKILSVDQWGTISWTSMADAFHGCENMNVTASDAPDLSAVTSTAQMFKNNFALNADFTGWDVSTVTGMFGMFSGASAFNGNISTWNVSAVTDFREMFAGAAAFNQDLSGWVLNGVGPVLTNSMFFGASVFNGDVSTWNVSAVTDMNSMFMNAAAFNQDISAWNVGSVVLMNSMFEGASTFNANVGGWDVSSVTNMRLMFSGAAAFNQDLNLWTTTSVTDFRQMFAGATNFNGNITTWDVSGATDLFYMFANTGSFNQDISGWEVSNVVSMNGMFNGASVFNQDLSTWVTSAVSDMSLMFLNANSFDQNLGTWDVSSVTAMPNMLDNSGLSTANYDATLNGWSVQTVQTSVTLGAVGLGYSSTGQVGRDVLTGTYSWLISDGGLLTPPIAPSNFVAYASSPTDITFEWIDNSNNETSFLIERAEDFAFTVNVQTVNASVLSDAITSTESVGVNVGGFYRITAVNGTEDASSVSSIEYASTEPFAGFAADFTVVDSEYDLGNPAELDFAGGNFTVETWYRLNDPTADGIRPIIQKDGGLGSNDRQFRMDFDPNSEGNIKNLSFVYFTSGDNGAQIFTGANTITDSEWHHIAVVRNGNSFEVYLDGTLIQSGISVGAHGTMFSATKNLGIGGNPDPGGGTAGGQLDELRFWNVARSQTQIQNFSKVKLNGNETGLVAYYPFDEGSGNATVDQSIYANHGSAVATANWVVSSAGAPIGPSGLRTVEVSQTQIDLSWTDNSSDETDFAIYRSDGNNSSFVEIGTAGGVDISTYTDNSVAPGNNYFYYVVARNGALNSSPSNEKAAATFIPPGNALTLDGVNDFINLAGVSSHISSGAFTWEGWFKIGSSGVKILYSDYSNAADQTYLYVDTDGKIFAIVGNGSTTYGVTSAGLISPSTWYHVAMVYDGSGPTNTERLKLYINGLEVSMAYAGTIPSTTYAGSGNFFVGARSDNSFYSDLTLDEFRIWSIPRTAQQIVSNMYYILTGEEVGLNAYYKFDQSDAGITVLPDRSQNQNDGTLGNFAGAASWNASGAFTGFEVVTNLNNSGAGSLRAAITAANGAPGTTILFNIPSPAPWTINLSTPLPQITANNTVIDGTTQPGWDMDTDQLIHLNLSGVAGHGLDINGDFTEIYGLKLKGQTNASWRAINIPTFTPGVKIGDIGKGNVIGGNAGGGIFANSDVSIIGNRIGTTANGLAADPNGTVDGYFGISLSGSAHTIDNNLLSGHSATNQAAVRINGVPPAGKTMYITNNYIGVNATGTAALPNYEGIEFVGLGAAGNIVIDGNLISGNVRGIFFSGDMNNADIKNNIFGLDAAATNPLPNTWAIYSGSGASDTYTRSNIRIGYKDNPNIIAENVEGVSLGYGSANGTGNTWSTNQIYNNGRAITFPSGINVGNSRPAITEITSSSISGTSAGNERIHIYLGDGSFTNQGAVFIDSVDAVGGVWSYSGLSLSNGDEVVVSGTNASGTSLFRSGQFIANNALHFDGIDDYVELGNPAALSLTGEMTIEAWINITSSENGVAIVSKADPAETEAENIQYLFRVTPAGYLWFTYEYGAGLNVATSTDYKVPIGTWTHVAASRTIVGADVTIDLYIDGVLAGTQTVPNLPTGGANSVARIGGNNQTNQFLFNGEMDEVRIWGAAKTELDIQSAMYTKLIGNEANLVGYYTFNEGEAGAVNTTFTTLPDATVNGLDGVLTNFALSGTSSNWVSSGSFEQSPGAPVNLITSEISNSQINLSWEDRSFNETDFAIYRSTGNNASFTEVGQTGGTNVTTFTDNTVSAGNNYFYHVVARNASGDSPTSNDKAAATFTPPGNALSFDGVDDHIEIPHNAAFDIGSTFSFEAWVNPSSYSANGGFLFNKWENAAEDKFLRLNSDGTLFFNLFNSVALLNSNSTIPIGEWTHVAVTYELGGNAAIYINGVLDASASGVSDPSDGVGNLYFGDNPVRDSFEALDRSFAGQLDEVRWWNFSRTEPQIQSTMNSSLVGNESGLVAYYKFDQTDPAITVLPDRSTSQHDGVLNNFGGAAGWNPSFSTTNTDAFITTWSTTDGTITIPVNLAYTYDYDITWTNLTNPGISEGALTNQTGAAALTGLENGSTYQIEITGTFPAIWCNNQPEGLKLLSIEQWGTNIWASMNAAFRGCQNMVYNATDIPDLSVATDLGNMFSNCGMFNGAIGGWDVSTVTNMSGMFTNTTSFNQDITGWSVGSVTLMNQMFSGSAFNQPIGIWDVSSVTNMGIMFGGSAFNQDLSAWDVSSVTRMSGMFNGNTAFNGDITTWVPVSVTNFEYMFDGATAFNQDISGWNMGSAQNLEGMFRNATSFNQPLGAWTLTAVWNMSNMFQGAIAFDQPLGSWNVSTVQYMPFMFAGATSFNQDISTWNTGLVEFMEYMFMDATTFNQPLNNWITSSVGDFTGMFQNASSFDQPLSLWDVSNGPNVAYMFENATSFNQDLSAWDTGFMGDFSFMFNGATSFDQDLSAWNIVQVGSMDDMLSNSGMSTANYDATLIGWSAQTVIDAVTLGATGLTYSSAGQVGRDILANSPNLWTITGDALACEVITITPTLTGVSSCSEPNGAIAYTIAQTTAPSGYDVVLYQGIGTGGAIYDTRTAIDGVAGDEFLTVEAGDYTIEVTNNDSQCTETLTVNVPDETTAPVITLGNVVITSESEVSALDGSIDLTTAVSGDLSFQWYTGVDQSSPIGGATLITLTGLASGDYTVQVTDNVSLCSSLQTFTVGLVADVTAPVVTVDVLLTNLASPELTGTVDDNTALVEITISGTTYAAINNGDGTWVLAAGTITPDLTDGIYDIVASATDLASNVGNDATTNELTIDLTSPLVTINNLATNVVSPELTGTVDDNTAQVEITVSGSTYAATNNSDGTWTLSAGIITPNLTDGIYEVNATATDIVGNVGTDASTNELTIDLVAPVVTVNEVATSITSPELTGTIDDPGATLLLSLDGGNYVPNNNGDGTWTLSEGIISPALADGTYEVEVSATDAVGNVGSDGTLNELIISQSVITRSANAITSTSFNARWSTGLDVQTYQLDISTESDFSNFIPGYNNFETTATNLLVTGLDFGTNYFYRVRLVNTLNEVSANSNVTNVKTIVDPETEADSLALVQIYNSILPQGLNWEAARLRSWDGITMSANGTRVELVNLNNSGSSGSMPNPFTGNALINGGLSALLQMNLGNNQLDGLMDFGNTLISSLDVQNNRLTFEDLEPIAALNLATFNYTGQASISFDPETDLNFLKAGNRIVPHLNAYTLTVSVGGSANVYTWYRDGSIITTNNDYSITGGANTILAIDYDNMGAFSVEVSNPLLPALTLAVEPETVLAVADLSMTIVDGNGNPLNDPISGYLLEAFRRQRGFDTLDVASNASSTFVFEDVIFGNYLCGIDPINKALFIPTYFGDAFEWDQADTIFFRSSLDVTVQMTEVPTELGPSDGEGKLLVIVEEDFGDVASRIDARRRAAKRKCGLKKRRSGGRLDQEDDEFELIAYGETNDNGEFEFGFLPFGTYRFFVEYPGIPLDESAFVQFEVGEAGISDTEFKLLAFATADGIEVSIERVLGIILDYFKDLKVYPNPSTDWLNVSYRYLNSRDVRAEIVDMAGNTKWATDLSRGYNGSLKIDVSDFAEGIYFLRFYDRKSKNENVVTYRVLINK